MITDADNIQMMRRDFCSDHLVSESVFLWDNSCNRNARVIRIAPTAKSTREAIIDSLNSGFAPKTDLVCFTISDFEVNNVPIQKKTEPEKPNYARRT